MMAIIMDQFGPPSVLEYREVAVQQPKCDEVVVKVHAVSVNRTLDLKVRADGDNRAVELPLVLGVDPSGIVAEIGDDVDSFNPGDRVAVVVVRCERCSACLAGTTCENQFHPGVERWGGYAQYITVPSWALVHLPAGIGFAAATVILRHYPTAHHLVASIAKVTPGERVLVLGSAGGLGSAVVEVANTLGAEVIAGAGADDRVAAGVSLGALWGVNYRTENLSERVTEFTNGKGVNVVIDNIGEPALWSEAFKCLGYDGRVVTAGAHGGGVVPLDVHRLYKNHLSILGTSGRSEFDVQWAIEMAGVGAFNPLIGIVMPLSQARRAHELAETNELLGKVILDPTAT
jgi:NADPH:quinone reductase-like Zn-dependent oxidoreductase